MHQPCCSEARRPRQRRELSRRSRIRLMLTRSKLPTLRTVDSKSTVGSYARACPTCKRVWRGLLKYSGRKLPVHWDLRQESHPRLNGPNRRRRSLDTEGWRQPLSRHPFGPMSDHLLQDFVGRRPAPPFFVGFLDCAPFPTLFREVAFAASPAGILRYSIADLPRTAALILVNRFRDAPGRACSGFLAPVQVVRVSPRKMDTANRLDDAGPNLHELTGRV